MLAIQNYNMVKIKTDQAGLISQLMHDVQAIIDLSENSGHNKALIKRINYQKKVNNNFLFWIRDCDLIKSTVSIKDFIYSSLEFISINSDQIKISIPPELGEISIDVELFSKAINEIIKNSITAVENDYSKIEITFEKSDSLSAFYKRNWIKIQIRDTGSGINEDFVPFVLNPFFTTSKERGSTGFGLPNAKKIIEAHDGHFEIHSAIGMGTIVKIYLPE